MSDDPKVLDSGTISGLPMAMFVRGGGTATSDHEKAIALAEEDAERRRDEALEERKIARIPIEMGGARLVENATLDPGAQNMHVLLSLTTSSGDPVKQMGVEVKCLADLRLVGQAEMAVMVVCPRCVSRGIPQGQCQIQVRQGNRNWYLSDKGRGEPIMFDGRMYQSAGTIMESERFRCPNCAWTARIDNNKLRAD